MSAHDTAKYCQVTSQLFLKQITTAVIDIEHTWPKNNLPYLWAGEKRKLLDSSKNGSKVGT